MKKIIFLLLFCAFAYHLNAQCTIDPFIQQHYETDAKLLVLREIMSNPNDVDRHNPIVSQSRTDAYLEKLSAIYQNPTNEPAIDSLFNEFQFHVNRFLIRYKRIQFRVNTDVSWVQTLKDTHLTNVPAIDNFLNQYQFSVEYFSDSTNGTPAITSFVLITSFDALNVQAIEDDFQNTAPTEITVLAQGTMYEHPCNYIGIPYQIPSDDLFPSYHDVVSCDILYNGNNRFLFYLNGNCPYSPVSQSRYVTVSDDCSTATFSRTLSSEDFELNNVSIYPNPASNSIHIQGVDSIQTVEIHSIQGKKMQVSVFNSQIDISSLQSGIYFLKITDEQNRSVIKKIIKK
ncbi:T9SS type A sorting domain-containing protein [Kordia sp. TARA_039_SRF]|nr:T9SS type A sorting domain-containing protein [Kordia sp. TARA_039_SRF]